MDAILLAGGLGTRLRELVPDLPKPMAPVRGIPFLAHVMRHWKSQGVDHFILSVGYKKESIRNYFQESFEGVPVSYSIETKPLGTGGALYHALSKLEDKSCFLVVNGDTYLDVELPTLTSLFERRPKAIVVALARVAQNSRYAEMVLGSGGKIRKMNAEPSDKTLLINAGAYLIDSNVLPPKMPEAFSFEESVLPRLIEEGKCFGVPCEGRFLDIGVPEDYLQASTVLPDIRPPRM